MSNDNAMLKMPSPDAVRKATTGKTLERSHVLLPENLADNRDIVDKFRKLGGDRLNSYKGQTQRKELETKLATADRLWRLTDTEDTGTTKRPFGYNLSKAVSEQFHISVRLLAAAHTSICFPDNIDHFPAQFTAKRRTGEYSDTEGRRVAEGENLLIEHTNDVDLLEDTIRESMLFLQKNTMEIHGFEWEYETREVTKRVPGYYSADGEAVEMKMRKGGVAVPPEGEMFNEAGQPIGPEEVVGPEGEPRSFAFVKKIEVVKENPHLQRYSLRNFFFDLSVDNIQRSSGVFIELWPTYQELLDRQRDGHYINVEKVQRGQQATGSEDSGDVKNDMDANAGEGGAVSSKLDGLPSMRVLQYAPITQNDNGEWEWDDGAVPQLFEAFYVGSVEDSLKPEEGSEDDESEATGAVCLQLRRWPYNHGEYPFFALYSHNDDRGGVHIGNVDLLHCVTEQQTIGMRQHEDTVTLNVKTPFIRERGRVYTNDLRFKEGNQVFDVAPGAGKTALTQLDVKDLTGTILPYVNDRRSAADRIANTPEVLRGEFAGSRTTGTEVLSAQTQAWTPIVEDAKRNYTKYFVWLANLNSSMYRQFGDPARIIEVTRDGEFLGEVNPGTLYGSLNCRVTTFKDFKADLAARQSVLNFIQIGGLDRAMSMGVMDQNGATAFFRIVGRVLQLPDASAMFPGVKRTIEAEREALRELFKVRNDPVGALQDPDLAPQQGEQHDVWIRVFEEEKAKLEALRGVDPEAFDQRALSAIEYLIVIRKGFAQKESAQMLKAQGGPTAQQPGAPVNQSSQPVAMPGEGSGDVLSGMMGQTAGAQAGVAV